jgi:hypothetical protein
MRLSRRTAFPCLLPAILTFVLLAVVTTPVLAAPQENTIAKCTDGRDNDRDGLTDADDPDCEGVGGGDPPSESNDTHEGVVGHDFGIGDCGTTCASCSGDFYDVGTENPASGVSSCEDLTCQAGSNSVVCGVQGQPRPRVYVQPLLDHLWSNPDLSRGDPAACFGNGVIGTPVHTAEQGGAGQIQLYFFFKGTADGSLAGCNGTTDNVKYVLDTTCFTADEYPPPAGVTAEISCAAGSPVTIKTEGGGRVAKKCGCTAEGLFDQGATIKVRVPAL